MNEQRKQAVEEAAEKITFDVYGESDDSVDDVRGFYKQGVEAGMYEVINSPEKYGLQPINEWVSVSERLPIAWETGGWDGKRTDEVLIRKTDGKYAVGRMYTGVIDGVEFSDWSEGREEWLINTKDITHWKPINEREEG